MPDDKADWKRTAIFEVAKQGPVFIILVLILVGGGWLGYHALTEVIPKHVEAVQVGYERLEFKANEERLKLQAANRADSDETRKVLVTQTQVLAEQTKLFREIRDDTKRTRKAVEEPIP